VTTAVTHRSAPALAYFIHWPRDLIDAVYHAIERDIAFCRYAEAAAEPKAIFSTLTRREQGALELVVAGLMNKQIAETLEITQVTVKLHLGNVIREMHAKTAADLVRIGRQARRCATT
jgi:FixJ family two-component response regulator